MNLFAPLPGWTARVVRSVVLATLLSGGALAAHPAVAQDTKAADVAAYTMKKRVFTTGEVNRYKLAMKVQTGGQDITVNMAFKETIKDAKPSGEFTILNEFESAMANIGGMEQDISTFLPTITVMRDKDGKLSNKTEGGNEQASAQISTMMQQLSTMQEPYLPKNPVKVGDKWKISVTAPGPAGGTNKTEGEATLIGTEVVSGVKSLKLKVVADVDNKEKDTKAHTESTLNLDPDSGKLLKMTTKLDGTAEGSKIGQEMEISLVPADKKADPADKK
jgi:hypothetical protein